MYEDVGINPIFLLMTSYTLLLAKSFGFHSVKETFYQSLYHIVVWRIGIYCSPMMTSFSVIDYAFDLLSCGMF